MLPKFEHYLVSPQMSLQSLELQLKRSKVIEICRQREDMPPIVEIVEYEKLQLKSNIKRFAEDTTLLQGLMIGIVIFWGGKKYVCSNRLICFGRMWCRSHGRRWRLSRITYGSDVRGQISSALPISHLYWPFLLPPLSLRFCWVPMLYQIPPLQYQGLTLTHKIHIYIFFSRHFPWVHFDLVHSRYGTIERSLYRWEKEAGGLLISPTCDVRRGGYLVQLAHTSVSYSVLCTLFLYLAFA